MTMMTDGISAAEWDCLILGARKFFESQGTDVLLEFLRREGGNPLPAEFGKLAAPDAHQEPGRRRQCIRNTSGQHAYW